MHYWKVTEEYRKGPQVLNHTVAEECAVLQTINEHGLQRRCMPTLDTANTQVREERRIPRRETCP